jgi:translocation and assembly module TamA
MARRANSGNTVSFDRRPLLALRVSLTALAACLALCTPPLAAQGLPTLDDLIPPEAVSDPEAWAQGGSQPDEGPGDPEPDLAADSPMEPMPLLTLEPPESLVLAAPEPDQPAETITFVTFDDVIPPLPTGEEARLSDELVLVLPLDRAQFPERDAFIARFKELSSIAVLDDDGSTARLAAQARADEDLLRQLLRTYGYFDGTVVRTLDSASADGASADGTGAVARFDLIPGPRYRAGTVDLGALDQPAPDHDFLREQYGVFPSDPLSLDTITLERIDLDAALGENGYPFATIAEPQLLVDHARAQGDLNMPVEPGGRYVFGTVTSNLEQFLPGDHLADIARFDPGDLYRRSDEQDLRRAILATGLVGSVALTPVAVAPPSGDAPGTVDLAVVLTPAPLRTLAGSIGYGSDEGVRLAGSWEHRNLFAPEGSLRIRGIAGTQEQLAGVTFRKNNFHGRDRILTLDAFANTVDTDAYNANTLSLTGSYERVSTLLFQKPLSYGGGLELVATQEREIKPDGQMAPRETYFIAALPAWVQFDSSDDLLDPTRGFRARGAISPALSRLNSANSAYVTLQFDLSTYHSLNDNVVLAARGRLGAIVGADIASIAPSRRFYAGGGGSVRGYGYQAIGPQDGLGQPNGGRSLLELAVEARVRTGLLDGALALVPFLDAGAVNTGAAPDLRDIRVGAGLGLRYETGFGPIRVDVGVPLNRRPGDARVGVYVALGQAF